MGRRKPATHTIDVHRPTWHGGHMLKHPCRLTKQHIILVPDHGWKFNRATGYMVGGGYLGPTLDLDTLTSLTPEEE